MKVILLRDVAKLGRRHAVLEVPDGFALNKLIPQKLATPATPENLKKVLARSEHIEQSATTKTEQFIDMLKRAEGVVFEISMDANAQDHLFKAVKTADVVTAMNASGFAVEPAMVELSLPIKVLGEHIVGLVHGTHKGTITIRIIRK